MVKVSNGGRYVIVNKKVGSVIDLHTGDNKRVQGYQRFGGANQQWVFNAVQGFSDRYTIKSVATNTYLGLNENENQNGQKIVASTTAFQWVVTPSSIDQGAYNFVTSGPLGTRAVDLSGHGNNGNGTPIELWPLNNSGEHQVWRLDAA